MPINFAIDGEANVLTVSASGVICVLERADLVCRLLSDSSLPERVPILIDVSAVTNFLEAEDLPKLTLLIEQLGIRFKSKIAYFVVKPGMVTSYHLIALSVHPNIAKATTFCCKQEAYRWLTSDKHAEKTG